jgi:hypothetical protein
VEPVVGQSHVAHAGHRRRGDHAPERVRVAEPGIVDEDDEDVGRVLGRLRAHHDRPVGDGLPDRAPGDTGERRVAQREDGAIGFELAGGLGQRGAKVAERPACHLHPGLRRRARERLLGGQQVVLGDEGEDHGGARLQLLAEPGLEPTFDPVLRELPDQSAGGRADGDGGEQRRRREADQHTHAATPPGALPPELVAGVRDDHPPVVVALHEHRAVGSHVLGGDQPDQAIEVTRCRVDRLVRRQDQVHSLTHRSLLARRVASFVRTMARTSQMALLVRWCLPRASPPSPGAGECSDGASASVYELRCCPVRAFWCAAMRAGAVQTSGAVCLRVSGFSSAR